MKYFYITNLQGDVVGIANSYGIVGYYEYDAWGRILSINSASSNEYGALTYNPLRYRGYIYDTETGFYYLQSRYYDPAIRRFISADKYLSTGTGLLGYNMYAYCNNNPVNILDSTGSVPEWLKNIADFAVTAVTAAAAVYVGIKTTVVLAPVVGLKKATATGIAAGSATFGLINNVVVNAIYYEFSDGESNLQPDSYNGDYLSRWERLDYAKQQTGEEHYNLNAWRYYSEYSLHMYGWYATGWAYEKNIPVISKAAGSFKSADVDSQDWDTRAGVNLLTVVIGLLGL